MFLYNTQDAAEQITTMGDSASPTSAFSNVCQMRQTRVDTDALG